MSGVPHLRLVAEDGESLPEAWADIPSNALVNFTLSKSEVDSGLYGIRGLLEANRSMMLAVAAAQVGDVAETEKRIGFAFSALVSGNASAERLYAAITRRSRRSKPRRAKS